MKIYVGAVEVLTKKERQDETQFYAPNLVEKLVWAPATPYCKIFILSYAVDGLLC